MTVRQLEVLRIIQNEYGNRLKEGQALEFNQVIFGSLCTRGWVDWSLSGTHFYVTREGRAEQSAVETWMPMRKQLTGHLEFGKRAARVMRAAQREAARLAS